MRSYRSGKNVLPSSSLKYIFAGPELKDVICRYNLFSGGGVLPPLWGLGVYYRGYGDADAAGILKLASYFREKHIPVSVMGLEPGWQSHAYSCSLTWTLERTSCPISFILSSCSRNWARY